jgi:hypothetical protein
VLSGVLMLSSGVAQAAIAHLYTGSSFGPGGVSSGSFGEVVGVTVDQSSGDVFVLDNAEGGRVYKFDAAGEPVDFSSSGTNLIEGVGSANGAEEEIAVDSSSGADAGDIYVANNSVVKIYAASGAPVGELSGGETCGVAVDPSGNVYVGSYNEGLVRRYAPSTSPVTNLDETGSMGGLGGICNIAADASGNVFAANFGGGVREYDAVQFGSLAASGTLVDEGGRTLAVDGSTDEAFIDEARRVRQYDASVEPPTLQGTSGAAGEGALNGSLGVAVDHASGKLYVGDGAQVEIFGAGVSVASASTEGVSALTATEATVHGSIEPAGTEVTGCVFEYGTEPGALNQSVPCEPATPYTGNAPVAVTARLTGLPAATTYYYRVAESNATYTSTGTEQSFATKGPQILGSSLRETYATAAVVEATINPEGEATTYHVEYGATTAYGSSTAPLSAGSGEEPVAVTARIAGIQPEATYHARLVAVNGAGTTYGQDLEFTTHAMVVGEHFAEVGTKGAALHAEIDTNGEPTTYRVEYGTTTAYGSSIQPVTIGAEEIPVPVVVHLSELTPNTTYHLRLIAENTSHTGTGPDLVFTTQPLSPAGLPDNRGYEMVTPAVNQGAEVYAPYDAGALFSETTIPTEFPFEAAVDGSAVTYPGGPTSGGNGSQGEGDGNQYLARRSANGGWTQTNLQPPGYNSPAFWAFSSDLQYGILSSREVLAAGAPKLYEDLYIHDNATGASQPLSTVTPPYRSPERFGSLPTTVLIGDYYAGASADFTHQLFMANDALTPESEGGPEEHFAAEPNLYESVEGRLSAVNVLPDGSPAPNAMFGTESGGVTERDFSHAISSDGARVYWTDLNTHSLYVREGATTTKLIADEASYLTASADGSRVLYAKEGDLYEDQTFTGITRDLAPNGELKGILGASEDLEFVYFAAEAALAPGASPGQTNLYLYHDGETRFIATLGRGYEEVLESFNERTVHGAQAVPWSGDPSYRTAEVTPSGHGLVFLSTQRLTGYDNVLPSNSRAVHEVYVYDADSGALSCASCDPTGEQPTGRGGLASQGGFFPVSGSQTTHLRVISEDGSRVFFESVEPLVPKAQNGVLNVYEWERDGSGSCEFANGCIYLLSTGSSSTPSYFLDASANGNDVFLITRSQLVPTDGNEYTDVYDARVGAVEAPAAPQCTGTGCQGVQAAAPVFATPASVTYAGVGNFASAVTPVARPPVKAKKKPKCVAKKKKGKVKGKKSAKGKPVACKGKRTAKRARSGKSERGGR